MPQGRALRRQRGVAAALLAAALLAALCPSAAALGSAAHVGRGVGGGAPAEHRRLAAEHQYGDEPGFVWQRQLPAGSQCGDALRAAQRVVSGVALRPAVQAQAALLQAMGVSTEAQRLALRRRNAAVEVVNVGEGTTGTRGVFHWWGSPKDEGGQGIPGVHHKQSRMPPSGNVTREVYKQELLTVWGLLRQCAAVAPHVEPLPWQPGSCLSKNMLNTFFSMIEMGLSSGAVHVSDTPYNGVAVDVLEMVPEPARWLLTVRDPLVWAQKRIEGHGHVPICRREWAANASSWFNLAECIAAAGDARLALETQTQSVHRDVCDDAVSSDTPHAVLAQKHALHNRYLVEMLQSRGRDVREVCLWDEGGLNALAGARVGGEVLPLRTMEVQQAMRQPSTQDNGYNVSEYTDKSTCAAAHKGSNALRDGSIKRRPACGYQGSKSELIRLVHSKTFMAAVARVEPLDSPYRKPLDVTLPVVGLGLPRTRGLEVAAFLACHGIGSAFSSCTCDARIATSWSGTAPPSPPSWAQAQCGLDGDCGCLVRACAARGEPLLDCAPAFEAVFGLEGDDWVRKTADTGKCSLPQVSHLQQLVDKTPGATFVLTLRRNAEEWADRITLEETNAIMACREELGLAPYTAEASGPALRRAALREILEAHVQMVNAVFNAAANGARLVVVGDSDSLSTDLHNALGGERACMVQRQARPKGKA